MNFSETLLNFRARHHLSQSEAGAIIGVAQCDISGYEHERKKPTRRNEILYMNKMKEYERGAKK